VTSASEGGVSANESLVCSSTADCADSTARASSVRDVIGCSTDRVAFNPARASLVLRVRADRAATGVTLDGRVIQAAATRARRSTV